MIDHFTNEHYQRHNRRRQEHLASLSLPLAGKSVIEVGAGIGDHTEFFLDRGCRVTSTDARANLVELIQKRYSNIDTAIFDANSAAPKTLKAHDIVYAYGVLYHLHNPTQALASMAHLCSDILLLETCVTPGPGKAINLVAENRDDATQAAVGDGCRPTRDWVWAELAKHFEHVYSTTTQPWHEEFPLDWDDVTADHPTLTRCVFVASRSELSAPNLINSLPKRQIRSA